MIVLLLRKNVANTRVRVYLTYVSNIGIIMVLRA